MSRPTGEEKAAARRVGMSASALGNAAPAEVWDPAASEQDRREELARWLVGDGAAYVVDLSEDIERLFDLQGRREASTLERKTREP